MIQQLWRNEVKTFKTNNDFIRQQTTNNMETLTFASSVMKNYLGSDNHVEIWRELIELKSSVDRKLERIRMRKLNIF